MNNNISTELRENLISKGASLVGFADLKNIPPDVRDNLPYGISIAVALSPQIITEIGYGPTKEYYAEYQRVNELLNSLGYNGTDFLTSKGYKAVWLPATDIGINSTTLSTKLPHKTTATRAGLGWIGKTALLVTKQFGSAVRITGGLTDADLSAGTPIDSSLCGTCTSCTDICPAHASSGTNWDITRYRDSFFNAFACRKTARELAKKNLGIQNSICGRCIWACPWTQKYLKKKM
jgi:epoxyqueuosine reductase